jgi:proteasome accessory factor C
VTAGPARLVRLLNMVPYFLANPRVTYAKAAADLGVTRKQLERDIDQLWVCGMPGYYHGDLIDFELSGDTISVSFTAGMDRPLRLTSAEATDLLMALNALADIPGVVDPAAARSAIAKIEAAAGTASGSGMAPDSAAEESAAAGAVRQAAHDQRALEIEYFSASRDAQSSRVVDPIRVVLLGDQSYLEAWCREAEAVRLFRFDRILKASVLDEPAAAPKPAVEAPTNTALFDADPSLESAKLRISPRSAWMLEYFPMRVTAELPDGWCEAEMTYAAEDWVARQILGFGADVRVLAPDSLARKVRQAATDALAAYAALDC